LLLFVVVFVDITDIVVLSVRRCLGGARQTSFLVNEPNLLFIDVARKQELEKKRGHCHNGFQIT
jgi:hypothetical protein